MITLGKEKTKRTEGKRQTRETLKVFSYFLLSPLSPLGEADTHHKVTQVLLLRQQLNNSTEFGIKLDVIKTK